MDANSRYYSTLLSGTHWPLGVPGPTGVPDGTTHISYTYWQQTPSYDTNAAENNGFQPFTATMQTATDAAWAYIKNIANITPDLVTPPPTPGDVAAESAVNVGYGMAFIDPNAEAYTYYPNPTGYGPIAGDVWANESYYLTDITTGAPDPNALHVQPGNYDWLAIWHETGHALGLKHPFEKPHTLISSLDTDQYTIMSYTHSSHYTPDIYPETYMPLDILAIQKIYGANTTYNNGPNNYVLNPDHIYTIWDTGGLDTLDGSAQSTNEVLDLRDGHYSTVNSATSITDNIAIAFGVTIENASGGSGDDVIYDNSVTNVINTGDGNNTVWLTTGDDTVIGGAGNDTIHMGIGNDSVDGGGGTDTLIFNASVNAFLFNDAAGTAVFHGYTYTFANDETFKFSDGTFNGLADQILSGSGIVKGGLGNDTITGTGAGIHTLYGYAGDDLLMGGPAGSADRMYGGTGNDTYMVDNTHDICVDLLNNPAGGTDTVISSVSYALSTAIEDLTLSGSANLMGRGNALDNIIIGSAGNDVLQGLGGNDTLEGGGGVNTLTGGPGVDTFLFNNADLAGTDTITDFSVKFGDKIDISNVLTGFDPLNPDNFIHLTASGNSTIVSIDQDGTANGVSFTNIATLVNVHLSDVQALIASGNIVA